MLYFLKYFFKTSTAILSSVAVLGIVSSASGAAIVSLFSSMFTSEVTFTKIELIHKLLYATVILTTLLVSTFSVKKILLTLNSTRSRDLRKALAYAVLNNPVRFTEMIGSAKLMAMYTDDINYVSQASRTFASVAVNYFVLAGAIGYLLWVFPVAVLILALAAIPALFIYRKLLNSSAHYAKKSLQKRDDHITLFENIITGSKELKLNSDRSRYLIEEEFESSVNEHQKAYLNSFIKLLYGDVWVQFFLFSILLAALAFSIVFNTDLSVLGSYVLIVLFMRTYIVGILGTISSCNRAGIILKRFDEQKYFDVYKAEHITAVSNDNPFLYSPHSKTVNLVTKGMRYDYTDENHHRVSRIGPINMTTESAQLIFVVGKNGTGKTTFAKLLSGLYEPSEGEILCNDVPVDSGNVHYYRQLFSALFTNPFVPDHFRWLPGNRANPDTVNSYIEMLGLDSKVSYLNGKLDNINLSHGQIKRLCLLASYLEDRPVLIFDEWAENQDKEFTEVFYNSLIPELKKRGKLIFIITHSSKYIHTADQVIEISVK